MAIKTMEADGSAPRKAKSMSSVKLIMAILAMATTIFGSCLMIGSAK